MIKKGLFLLIIMMSMLACSSKDEKITTIKLFQYKEENINIYFEMAEIYEKEHPSVNIEIIPIEVGRNYSSELKVLKNNNRLPTIFNIGSANDLQLYKDSLVLLNDFNLTKLAHNRYLKSMQIDEDTYGVPITLEGYGFLFNKKFFEIAGIDWRGINSWEKLNSAVTVLSNNKEKLGLNAVFAMAGQELWTTGLHDSQIFLSQEFKGDTHSLFKAKEIQFSLEKAFQSFIDLQVKNSVQPINSIDYTTQVEKLFALGKVAIIKQGSWVFDSIATINPELAANLGFLPLSSMGGEQDKIMVSAPMYWVINNKVSEVEQQIAKDFLSWIYTSELGKDYSIHRLGFLPPYAGFESPDLQSKNPLWQDINRYVKSDRTMEWVFSSYPKDWGMTTLGRYISSYIEGSMSWENVISESKKAWTYIRKEETLTESLIDESNNTTNNSSEGLVSSTHSNIVSNSIKKSLK